MNKVVQFSADRTTPPSELRPIGDRELPLLQRVFEKAHTADPYARSAAYFAMTGRNGLWLYGDQGRGIIVAQHPNDPSAILAFPPFGKNGADLLPALLDEPWLDGRHLLLSRFTAAALSDAKTALPRAADWIVEEKLLDWRYPVHVLDTDRVVARAGPDFRDFRKNLHRAERAGLTTRSLDPVNDHESIMTITRAWAFDHEDGGDDLTAPARRVLDLMERKVLPIRGLMVVDENDRAVAYSIWEETSPRQGMANGLSNSALPHIKGATELSYLGACQALRESGFTSFCIGGSESEGLDAFKRKMIPAASIELVTLDPARRGMAKAIRRQATDSPMHSVALR